MSFFCFACFGKTRLAKILFLRDYRYKIKRSGGQCMRKIWLCLMVLLGINATTALFAQDNGFREIDDRPWHYGFVLGINAYSFGVTPTDATKGAQVSSVSPGFSVGIIGDMRLSKFFNLRFVPTLNFADRTISYQDPALSTTPQTVKSSIVDLPIYLKYRSIWDGRSRPYLLFGGGITYDLGRDNTQPVLLKPSDFYVAVGVGCDFYFDYFRLAPELKFCFGLNNLLTPSSERTSGTFGDPRYSDELSKLTSRVVVLSFNFE